MLSIEKCNQILNQKEKKYNEEKIKAIRDFLYQMAELDYLFNKTEYAKCNNIHKGKH